MTFDNIPKSEKRQIIHIINPVKVKSGNPSYLDIAQPITFQSMINAKAIFEEGSYANAFEIKLCTVQFPEDRAIIPNDFIKFPDLKKSVLDLPNKKLSGKKLPFLIDIISSVKELNPNSEDIIVLTNSDIGLQTNFYSFVVEQINSFDAFVINRRDLPKENNFGIPFSQKNLKEIYHFEGKKHPGFDCFIFPFHNLKNFQLGKVFIGYPPIGRVILENLKKLNSNFKIFTDEKLTFHLGEDRAWKMDNPTNNKYYYLNYSFADELGFSFNRNHLKKEKPKSRFSFIQDFFQKF